MRTRLGLAATVLTVVAVLSGTVAGAAAAGTIAVDRPCYSPGYYGGPRPAVGFTLSGFAPGSTVRLDSGPDGGDLGVVAVGTDGGVRGTFPVPGRRYGDRTVFRLTAEPTDGSPGATTSFTVAPVTVGVSLTPYGRVWKAAFGARGFVGGKTLYAHWVDRHRKPGGRRFMGTVRLGALRGPCGDLDLKAVRLERFGARIARGIELWFDTHPGCVRHGGLRVKRAMMVVAD